MGVEMEDAERPVPCRERRDDGDADRVVAAEDKRHCPRRGGLCDGTEDQRIVGSRRRQGIGKRKVTLVVEQHVSADLGPVFGRRIAMAAQKRRANRRRARRRAAQERRMAVGGRADQCYLRHRR